MPSINSNQKDSWLSSFAGVGTLAGGGTGYCAINKHYNKIADKTVKMFDGTLNRPDVFLRRNNELLTEAANSTKGFFGKINRAIGQNNTNLGWDEKIRQGASDILDRYSARAARTASKRGLTGEALNEGIKEITNKNITKDIAKSIKNVSKNKTVAIVLACAVVGTLLFNGIAKAFKNTEAETPATKAKAVKSSKKLRN